MPVRIRPSARRWSMTNSKCSLHVSPRRMVSSGSRSPDARVTGLDIRKSGIPSLRSRWGKIAILSKVGASVGGPAEKAPLVGLLSSLGAVAAACACCTLPLILAAFGMGLGVTSAVTQIGYLRWPMTALALVSVTLSWWSYFRRRARLQARASTGATPQGRFRLAGLIMATGFALVALFWSFFEPSVMRMIL